MPAEDDRMAVKSYYETVVSQQNNKSKLPTCRLLYTTARTENYYPICSGVIKREIGQRFVFCVVFEFLRNLYQINFRIHIIT